ncbi:MAG: hypothetical protein HRU15_10690 [Planctomycetes bacterium]|nr:hypothetical protein [Planctomycetota bacterium]
MFKVLFFIVIIYIAALVTLMVQFEWYFAFLIALLGIILPIKFGKYAVAWWVKKYFGGMMMEMYAHWENASCEVLEVSQCEKPSFYESDEDCEDEDDDESEDEDMIDEDELDDEYGDEDYGDDDEDDDDEDDDVTVGYLALVAIITPDAHYVPVNDPDLDDDEIGTAWSPDELTLLRDGSKSGMFAMNTIDCEYYEVFSDTGEVVFDNGTDYEKRYSAAAVKTYDEGLKEPAKVRMVFEATAAYDGVQAQLLAGEYKLGEVAIPKLKSSIQA